MTCSGDGVNPFVIKPPICGARGGLLGEPPAPLPAGLTAAWKRSCLFLSSDATRSASGTLTANRSAPRLAGCEEISTASTRPPLEIRRTLLSKLMSPHNHRTDRPRYKDAPSSGRAVIPTVENQGLSVLQLNAEGLTNAKLEVIRFQPGGCRSTTRNTQNN